MDEIIELILKSYEFKNPTQIKIFLESLRDGQEYHKRLLICLGIDTKGQILDKKEIKYDRFCRDKRVLYAGI